jgi:hypothetical protein
MFYILVLDGPSAQEAKPVVATRDPVIVRVVADAIVARLRAEPMPSLIEREHSGSDLLMLESLLKVVKTNGLLL